MLKLLQLLFFASFRDELCVFIQSMTKIGNIVLFDVFKSVIFFLLIFSAHIPDLVEATYSLYVNVY